MHLLEIGVYWDTVARAGIPLIWSEDQADIRTCVATITCADVEALLSVGHACLAKRADLAESFAPLGTNDAVSAQPKAKRNEARKLCL